ncbi:ricin-type beta-trefoil lectin domain protein [Actinoplanes sp. NPDC026619]|uniref:ricin-type beta-trefoil lectin domain protein n=1 Tax=Actinoplanes sp. NPDC026619 TaxID=3155798 RepID=UPI0034034F35
MAALNALRRRVTSSLPRGRTARLVAGAAATLLLTGVGGAVAGAALHHGSDSAELVGDPVPADQVAVIARAALACPQLTAARLAGQLMAASRFKVDATTPGGGSGVAGLTDAQWQLWAPWPGAQRHDPAAETTALAHLMCDLAGQLRRDDLGDDLWQPMLAAHQSGVDAVRTARGVPDEAREYVRTVVGYADWYTNHSALVVPAGSASSMSSAAPVKTAKPIPLPATLVPLVVAAGKQCPQVTGARIAGQLMAASAFRADVLGSDGAQGIAQFLPALWSRYARAGQSPWQPKDAVPTLATAMCSLTSALGGLTADPYPAALGAFRGGPVTAAPTSADPAGEFADQVLAFAAYYAKDPRMATATAAPGAAVPAVPPTVAVRASSAAAAAGNPPAAAAPGVGGTVATTTAAAAPPKTTGATPVATAQAAATFKIVTLGDKCLDVPSSGTRLQIWTCTGASNQQWSTGSDGSLRSGGKCLSLAGGGADNGTAVVLAGCSSEWYQKFWVNDSNDLVNYVNGKCVDVVDNVNADGTQLQLWDCTGGANQKWSRQ